jgi:hypothetical protein
MEVGRFLGMPASAVAIGSISVGVTTRSRGSFASLATMACPAVVVLDQILLSGWGGASQACGGIRVGASAGPLTLGCGCQGRASGGIEGRRHRRSFAKNQGRGLGRDAGSCWGAWLREMEAGAGAAARMAVGVGAGRGGGCAHGRVPVAAGAPAGAGVRGGNQTVSDGGGVDNPTVEMEAGACLC